MEENPTSANSNVLADTANKLAYHCQTDWEKRGHIFLHKEE